MLKSIMLENEMEKYLAENEYDIYDEEGTIDSVSVADIACEELGYSGYILDGVGGLDQTLIFIHEQK